MIKVKVTALTLEHVTMSFDDGQTLTLPRSVIEGTLSEGMEIALICAALGSEDAGRQALARDLLNGLLSA